MGRATGPLPPEREVQSSTVSVTAAKCPGIGVQEAQTASRMRYALRVGLGSDVNAQKFCFAKFCASRASGAQVLPGYETSRGSRRGGAHPRGLRRGTKGGGGPQVLSGRGLCDESHERTRSLSGRLEHGEPRETSREAPRKARS